MHQFGTTIYYWIRFTSRTSAVIDLNQGFFSIQDDLVGAPISAILTIFTPDALPGTTLPIYPGLGQAPNMLACIPGGFKH